MPTADLDGRRAEPAFLNVMENADRMATLGPVAPAADGSLVLTVAAVDTAGQPQDYTYLGALEISGRAAR